MPDEGTIKDLLEGHVRLRDVSVVYGEKSVLKDVSFEVEKGSSLAIIGPTAAGKSQLLYLLSGLINADKGTVEYDNRPISAYKKEKFLQACGICFPGQHPLQYEHP